MIGLPAISQAVGVYVVDWEVALRSRLEELDEVSLTIATPSDGRSERPLPRGSVVYLDWLSDRGLVRVRGIVSEVVHIPIPALRVIVDGKPEVHQRRNYVRTTASLPVAATPLPDRLTDMEPITMLATSFDISGGGMRLQLMRFEAEVGARLELEITMPDETVIDAVGAVTRRPLTDVYCIEFVEISKRDQERIVRFVFQQLRTQAGRAA
jgi:c-di-GMP-binding flagellar brake protein YcgR